MKILNSHDTNSLIDIYTSNHLIDDAYRAFSSRILNFSFDEYCKIHNKVGSFLMKLTSLDLSNLFISQTSQNSILFRFSTTHNNEFKAELFYDFDEKDEDDLEAILHAYEDGNKVSSYFGSIDEIYSIISQLSTKCYNVYGMAKKEMAVVYKLDNSYEPYLSAAFSSHEQPASYSIFSVG